MPREKLSAGEEVISLSSESLHSEVGQSALLSETPHCQILNAVSMGVGGSMVMGTFQAVVDFGDPTHIQTIVEECNSPQLMEDYTRGTELATKMRSEGHVVRDLSKYSALSVVTAASVTMFHPTHLESFQKLVCLEVIVPEVRSNPP